MRQTNKAGVNLIKSFEGYSNKPYKCAAGYWTIGYGHLMKGGYQNITITEERAEELLKNDLYQAELSVLRNINRPLSDNQFAALVSFTFNLGGAVLQRSTLRRVLNAGNDADVRVQLERYVWAGGRKLAGLIKRRDAEADLFESTIDNEEDSDG